MLSVVPARLPSAVMRSVDFKAAQDAQTHLFTEMQNKHNHGQHSCRNDHRQRDPWDPLPRSEVQLLPPWPVVFDWRNNHDLRVRDNALHVDEMLRNVLRRADKQVLDVVVRASKTEVGVRCEEGMVACLWELPDYTRD